MQQETGNHQPLRIGVIGCANIARKAIDAIHHSKFAKVLCVGSRSLENAKQFASECKVEKAYGSYDEVLNDDQVDAVYVPLPTMMKREWALKAIEKGKHVLVEKPFASEEQVADMIKLCQKRGVKFMDGTMWVHHLRTFLLQERFLCNPELPLGELKRVHAVLTVNLISSANHNIRFKHDLEPAGCIGDLAWYCVRGILWAYQWELPTRVFCTSVFCNKNPIDSTGILWFPRNRIATFAASFSNSTRQSLEMSGEKATLSVRDGIFFPFHNEPFEYPSNWSKPDLKTSFTLVDGCGNETTETIEPFTQVYAWIDDFALHVQGKSKANWEEQTLKTQRVLDALIKSAEKEEIISVSPYVAQ